MATKDLNSLLGGTPGTPLADLAERAKSMDSLADQVRSGLDPSLADGIRSVNLRDDGDLAVLCRSAGHASRIRFEEDRIRAVVTQAGHEIRSVRVRVSREQSG